ncbi:hypothetical protein JD844_023365 [Phrynosoma platyrhinos]|uniref:Uncharacterized protein n=1 Tax=Phrynosoma platyrhinos TaxID=52577 RepID=A0ABQ7SWD9_PHRPL|nr:hypothetical protein JD844_023365 [Phrynosoma platyrhinos]
MAVVELSESLTLLDPTLDPILGQACSHFQIQAALAISLHPLDSQGPVGHLLMGITTMHIITMGFTTLDITTMDITIMAITITHFTYYHHFATGSDIKEKAWFQLQQQLRFRLKTSFSALTSSPAF